MTKKCFIELEGILISPDGEPLKDVIEIVNILSDHYDIYAFSVEREGSRMQLEQFLIDNEVSVEELFLRADNDYTKADILRVNFVLDFFSKDIEEALEQTAFIATNRERAVEEFREFGFRVISADW